jgi:glyoxylate utilization-related uncharacterized protein
MLPEIATSRPLTNLYFFDCTMRTFIWSLALIFACASVAHGIYDFKTSDVVELTEENWSQVEKSDHLWVVEFYAEW